MKELPIIIKADVQGSAEVLADTLAKLTDDKAQDPDHPLGRRRDQRVGRAAGVGVERDHHRLQRAARSQRRGHRRAREGRHPPALGHLQRDRRDEEGDGRPARADVQGSAHRRRRRCAKPSRCRRSAPSPAAWSPRAASRARATRRRACSATTSWSGKARSPRSALQGRRVARSRPASSAASASQNFNDVKVGDVIEVFPMERVAASRRKRKARVVPSNHGLYAPRRAHRRTGARRGQPDAGHRSPRSGRGPRHRHPRQGHRRSVAGARLLDDHRRRDERKKTAKALERAGAVRAAPAQPAAHAAPRRPK